MTDEQINIAIAESLGWESCGMASSGKLMGYKTEEWEQVPNYTADLNACHECVRTLTDAQRTTYREHLSKIWTRDYNSRCGLFPPHDDSVNATARQRCESYLRTLGRWIE